MPASTSVSKSTSTNASSSATARSKPKKLWMISTIVLAILLLIMTITTIALAIKLHDYNDGVLMYESRPEVAKPTEKVLADDLDVSYDGNFVFTKNEEKGYTDSYQEITVKNKSGQTLTFNITFEATNSDGTERLANDYLAVENLGPGQSQILEIFEDLPEAKAQEFIDKGVKFNITQAVEYDN